MANHLTLIVRRFPPKSRLHRHVGEGVQYTKNSDTQIITPLSTKMPPKQPNRAALIEEKVIQASQAMDEDPTLKGTKAAAQFGAPYDRLMACQEVVQQAIHKEDRIKSFAHLKITL
jgi:hypothetical protein